jgi:hypothetical protein
MVPDAALQRAAELFRARRLDEARTAALALVAAQPANFLALHLVGAIAVTMGRPEEALEHENRALAIHPNDHEALCNRGVALRMLGRIEEALADYDRVLAARPNFVHALVLKGVALAAHNRHAEAIASYSQALALDPANAQALFNRSLSELSIGDLEHGLADFEYRWKGRDSPIPMRPLGKPQWLGDDPRGKTILVHAEQQGHGDLIHYSRYVPLLAARGAQVVLEAPPSLIPVLTTLPARIVAMGEPLPPFDLHCPMMSLPLTFGTRLDTIPGAGAVSPRTRRACRALARAARSGRPAACRDRVVRQSETTERPQSQHAARLDGAACGSRVDALLRAEGDARN